MYAWPSVLDKKRMGPGLGLARVRHGVLHHVGWKKKFRPSAIGAGIRSRSLAAKLVLIIENEDELIAIGFVPMPIERNAVPKLWPRPIASMRRNG